MSPATFHLVQTVHGTLAYWSTGEVAVLDMGATSTKDGGTIGPRFVPLLVADRDALFGPTTRTRRATDAPPEVCPDCGEFGPCGRHADGK